MRRAKSASNEEAYRSLRSLSHLVDVSAPAHIKGHPAKSGRAIKRVNAPAAATKNAPARINLAKNV